jgi:hypothetical protein
MDKPNTSLEPTIRTGRFSRSKLLAAGIVMATVIAVGLIILSHNRNDAACLANVRAIMAAIRMYADDHHGLMPPSFDVLMQDSRYLPRNRNEHGAPEILVCPQANDKTVPSYRLQQVYNLKYPSVFKTDTVVLFEIANNGHAFGIVEALADGRVVTRRFRKPSRSAWVSRFLNPGISWAGPKARSASCIANLKALATAITMYADDNAEGRMPATMEELANGTYFPVGYSGFLCPETNQRYRYPASGKIWQANTDEVSVYCTADHLGGRAVLFNDGRVNRIAPDDLDKLLADSQRD